MTNRPSLQDIADDPTRLKALDLELLSILTDEAKAAKAQADLVSKLITSELEQRYGAQIGAAFAAQVKDTGTVHVEADGFILTADRAKRVEWAQDQLRTFYSTIAASGDDPSEYIDVEYKVQEKRYSSWPAAIKSRFSSARTLRPGPLSVKIMPSTQISEAA